MWGCVIWNHMGPPMYDGISFEVWTRPPTCYLDFRLREGSPSFQQEIPALWAYTLQGKVKFGNSTPWFKNNFPNAR